jgi:hypothetical protein
MVHLILQQRREDRTGLSRSLMRMMTLHFLFICFYHIKFILAHACKHLLFEWVELAYGEVPQAMQSMQSSRADAVVSKPENNKMSFEHAFY